MNPTEQREKYAHEVFLKDNLFWDMWDCVQVCKTLFKISKERDMGLPIDSIMQRIEEIENQMKKLNDV